MCYLMYHSAFILRFDHFLDSGAEICQIFHCFFLENFKKSKRHPEINWPLPHILAFKFFFTCQRQNDPSSSLPRNWTYWKRFKNKHFSIWHFFLFLCRCQTYLLLRPLITDKRTDVWSRPSCIYTQIFSPKKTGFPP